MTRPLSDVFLNVPFAHRGYHDVQAGRPENSFAAFDAAIASGFGIEMDVQMSGDGDAMVFHDYDLARLTGRTGRVDQMSSAALTGIPLIGGQAGMMTLTDALARVGGRVPLLIEVKDQDGQLGPCIGPLEAAVAAAVSEYDGPVALMSFNPHSVQRMAALVPGLPRGLVTDAFDADEWPDVPEARRRELAAIPDYDRSGASFVSHDVDDLAAPRLAELAAMGARLFCWTVRSPAQERSAREIVDNITFEGYDPGS